MDRVSSEDNLKDKGIHKSRQFLREAVLETQALKWKKYRKGRIKSLRTQQKLFNNLEIKKERKKNQKKEHATMDEYKGTA